MLKIEVEQRRWIKWAVNLLTSLDPQEISAAKAVIAPTKEETLAYQVAIVHGQGLVVLHLLNSLKHGLFLMSNEAANSVLILERNKQRMLRFCNQLSREVKNRQNYKDPWLQAKWLIIVHQV